MNPLISMIVPVYNIKKYLARCIDSIRNQTYQNMEVILIDDGSSDGSAEICDKFAKVDERITVIHQKNSGLSSALIAVLTLRTGNISCLLTVTIILSRTCVKSCILHFCKIKAK